jgi:hypothetical protein
MDIDEPTAGAWNADSGVSAAAAEPEAAEPEAAEPEAESPLQTNWDSVPDARAADDESSDDDESQGSGSSLSEDGVSDAGADSEASADDPFLRLGVKAGMVRRSLAYVDDLYSRLRSPSTSAWVYRLRAEVYPFAEPLRDRVAVVLDYESVFSGEVRDTAASRDFPIRHSELGGAVRLLQPIGAHKLGLELGFGRMTSGLDDPQGLSLVPEFAYTAFRSSLDLALNLGPVAVSASAGARVLSGFGQAAEVEWFPRLEGVGVEAGLGLTYAMSDGVSLEAAGTMRRFVLEMNSTPQDAVEGVSEVAGGAIDLYMSGYFGLSMVL